MFCSTCGASDSDEGSFCTKCGNALRSTPGVTFGSQAQPAYAAPSPPLQSSGRKNPLVAGILNLFIGLGYLYLGYRKVLGLPAIFFVLVVLVIDILVGIFSFGLVPLILAILLAYDGYVKAKGEKGYINTEPALLYQ